MVPLLGHQLNTFRKFANLKFCFFTALKKIYSHSIKTLLDNYSQWSRSNRISSAVKQGLLLSILQKPWTLITEKFIQILYVISEGSKVSWKDHPLAF